MLCLKDLASTGRTVVCSIHQPGSAIYALFDRVVLMAEGKCAFFGAGGAVLPHFESLGLPKPRDPRHFDTEGGRIGLTRT